MPADGSFQIKEYYPLGVGSTWHYQDTASNNHEFDLKVTEQTTVSGINGPAFRVAKLETEDFDVLTCDDQGLRLHIKRDKNGTIPWAPGVTFAAAAAKVGDAFTSLPDYRNPGTGNQMQWIVKAVKFCDITVPAGTFKNCVQLNISVKDEKLGTKFASVDMWLARGVGMVKRQGQFFGQYFVQLLLRDSIK
ncbi:MAG: hypothetical protein HY303_20935 [Candidatus Wallbacteria bacterium]|nr:hypothetical protein [Candidatus Wallbacteria bacterium]